MLEWRRRDSVALVERSGPMELSQALTFAASRTQGTLITVRPDGSPHASNVLFIPETDTLRISLTDSRVKTRNLRADPRCAMHVAGDSFWEYVVLEGVGELSPVAAAPDDATVEVLVDYYRRLSGEHPDWDEYRAAMVADRRLVLTVIIDKAYGQVAALP
jgi:PPOX class probable F420-dependent enzyme